MKITRKGALATAAVLAALAACGLEGTNLGDQLSQWVDPMFDNGGFETGGGSLSSWTVTPGLNATGLAVVPPTSSADLQLSDGGIVLTFPRTNATPESQPLQGMSPAAGIPRWPRFDTTSAVVNESNGANSTNANSLKQSYTVATSDVDASDGKVHVRFVLAPALQAAGHAPAQQPYYFVTLRNLTTGATLFTDFAYANNPYVPWRSQGAGPAAVLYTDWQINDIVPGNVALRVGDQIELEVTAARCQPGDHFGEVYVDGLGSTFPGLFIRKDGPPLANVDSNITYSFLVQNNTAAVIPNVVADETLPAGTTFVSTGILTSGIVCATPPVGGTGVVSCSLGSMSQGATGQFLVTVRAYPIGPSGSGTATAGAPGSLTDSTKAWTPNAFAGWTAYLVGGLGISQKRVILQNTATQLTVTPAWTTTPNNTTTYKIVNPPRDSGTASGSSANTLVDGAKTWVANQWQGYTVTVLSGAGAGQQRLIAGNTNNQLTVDTIWGANPGVGATYAIGLPADKVVNDNYTVRGDTSSPLLGPKVETAIVAAGQPAELRIRVTDGVSVVDWGSPVRYTVTVTNAGPLSANGARVTDTFPPELTAVTWTCTGAGGTCGAASGSGDINTTVNLLLGATVTFTVNATVVAGSGPGRLINVVNVAAPSGTTDFDLRNNSDADTDLIGTLSSLAVNKDPADSGRGTVTSSPAAINCGPACPSANATFSTGTVVTLTAAARPGDTFTGWAGACTGTATTCTVTMDQSRTVTAHFRGLRVIGVAGPGGTIDCNPPDVVQGGSSVCTITPDVDHILLTATDNGVNVIASVSNGTYTVANVTIDHTVSVTFDARPNFAGPAPTNVAQGSTYTYTPVVTDPDGPPPLTITVDPSDTCGGTLSGSYTFTPGPAVTCVVAIKACDGAGACRIQQTTVTINHRPVAVNDSLTTSGPIAILGGTLTANDSPGGSGAELSQTLTVTSVSGTSSQGGTVTVAGNVVTYTPRPGFVGIDTFTYTVTDDGIPPLSATATVTMTVTNNQPPIITSTAPGTATVGVTYFYPATSTDPDGPGATWSVPPGDTCGGSIDPTTGVYMVTPTGATPTPCTVAVQVCDGGVPNLCATQFSTVTVNGGSVDGGSGDGGTLDGGSGDGGTLDGGSGDGGTVDGGSGDGGTVDGGSGDGGTIDGGSGDGGTMDGGSGDGGTMDGGSGDGGTMDGGSGDGGTVDGGSSDGGTMDGGSGDGGTSDGGSGDGGTSDGGSGDGGTSDGGSGDDGGSGGFVDGVGVSGGGCGCSSGTELAALPWYGIPLLLAVMRRRRRKR